MSLVHAVLAYFVFLHSTATVFGVFDCVYWCVVVEIVGGFWCVILSLVGCCELLFWSSFLCGGWIDAVVFSGWCWVGVGWVLLRFLVVWV